MLNTHFSTQIIEAIAKALGDTDDGLTNPEIDTVAMACKLPPEGPATKWKRVNNLLVKDQNRRGNNRGIIAFIQAALTPALYVKKPERFETLRENVNRALSFEGLHVTAGGKVERGKASETISDALARAAELRGALVDRGVHPDVLDFCREELLADNYFHAVLEATKSLAQKLRDKSGLTEDGAELVDRALSGKTPMLCINNLATPNERMEQTGFASLCKGVFGMFRNPTAHAPRKIWKMEKVDAEDLMSTLSLIHRRLDKAKFG